MLIHSFFYSYLVFINFIYIFTFIINFNYMAAPKGNQYGKLAINSGKPKKFTPEELLSKMNDYFEYIDNNPKIKKKYEIYKGETKEYQEIIEQPYTIEGLCLFVGMDTKTFYNYENDKEYIQIITYARDRIYNNKLSGAIDGTFNGNVIIRDLSLKDSATVTHEQSIKELSEGEINNLKTLLSNKYGQLEPKTIDITPENEENNDI